MNMQLISHFILCLFNFFIFITNLGTISSLLFYVDLNKRRSTLSGIIRSFVLGTDEIEKAGKSVQALLPTFFLSFCLALEQHTSVTVPYNR